METVPRRSHSSCELPYGLNRGSTLSRKGLWQDKLPAVQASGGTAARSLVAHPIWKSCFESMLGLIFPGPETGIVTMPHDHAL